MIGSERLRVGTRPVEEGVLALAPDRQLHLVRAVAEAVVVHVVDERLRFLRDRDRDEELHGVVGAIEQRLQGGEVGLLAEALAQLDHAPLSGAAPGNDCEQVGPVHLRQADVVEDEPQHILLHLAALDDLQRRDDDPLFEDRPRTGRQRAGQRAAGIHLMPELRRPAHELVVVEDRHEHEPVVRVGDRRRALERVGREDHVARVHAPVPLLHHLVDVGAELAHDHAAPRVGEHRELVVLLADHRAHRGPEQHRVHFVSRVLEGALDDVQRDRVDFEIGDLGDLQRWVCGGCHLVLPPTRSG